MNAESSSILIVDDDELNSEGLARRLEARSQLARLARTSVCLQDSS
jgi:hypothetical protein